MAKEMVCLVCPNSCLCKVEGDLVSGAGCKRGERFVLQEMTSPMRTITTTVPCYVGTNREQIPVRTRQEVALKDIKEIMQGIRTVKLYEKPDFGSIISDQEKLGDIELLVSGG